MQVLRADRGEWFASRSLDPLAALLTALLAALGDAAGALAHHEALVRRLERELGARPSRETQALAERLAEGRDRGPATGADATSGDGRTRAERP